MSTLGKVFTVLVLLLSVAYLGITATLFAYRTDYKKALDAEKKARADDNTKSSAAVQAKDDEIKLKDSQVTALLQSVNKAQTEAKSAEEESKKWKEQSDKMDGELTKLRGQYETISGQISAKDQVIAQLTTQSEESSKRAKEADDARDAALQENQALKDRLSSAEKNLIDLEKQYIEKVKALEEAKGKLSMVPPDAIPAEARAVKAIDGKVLAVSKVMNLLIVNVGKDRGVEVGDQFTVFRGDKFVGKIQVEKSDKDWSSARMIEDFKRLDPSVGDDITSKAQ